MPARAFPPITTNEPTNTIIRRSATARDISRSRICRHRNWIVLTHIAWQEPSGILFMSPDDKGGALLQEILLQPGENQTVLSNQDLAKNSE